jgi:hypothetical protein
MIFIQKAAHKMLVNFTNILRAAFPPIFLHRKSIEQNFKYKKTALETFVQKAARKMMVKLTPDEQDRGTTVSTR